MYRPYIGGSAEIYLTWQRVMAKVLRPCGVSLVCALALVLAGCGERPSSGGAPPPPTVTVAKPTQRNIIDQDEYVGRFVAVDAVEVRARVSGYLEAVHFNDGHRYADFLPGTDKTAAYGIGGLILGATAAKAGFFKVIWLALLASKKLVFAGLIALGALIKRLFAGKQDASAEA